MPMRGKLPVPAEPPDHRMAATREVWAIVLICLTGYAVALALALYSQRWEDLPLLIAQSNQW